MDVGIIMKIVGIGLLVSVSCHVLGKSGREDQAAFVTIAGVIIVLLFLVGEINTLLSTVRSVFGI